MACECVNKINALLAEQNAILVSTFSTPSRVVIDTAKVDPRVRGRKPPVMLATHCPFCGTEYSPKPAAVAGQPERRDAA